jgi:uncharacterized membrane protein (DUF4010 family)
VLDEIVKYLPPEGLKILLVLSLSFLMGLEREEHQVSSERYSFGGVRTFPLIALIGYTIALLSDAQLTALMVGFAVIGGFLMLSYRHKLDTAGAGVTTEISGLTTYLVGALVYSEQFWIATTLTVLSMLLLVLKTALQSLTRRIDAEEILTLAKFLLVTAVILPVLPNQEFGWPRINPFKTWLVVVAVSVVSYASYLLQKLTRQQHSLLLAAILGGAYSSTVTTVVLAKRSTQSDGPHLFAGAILVASGVMYLRLMVLLGLFNRELLRMLAPAFAILAAAAGLCGWLWSRRAGGGSRRPSSEPEPHNPLELSSAVLFAILFVAVLLATRLALDRWGRAGIYTLAAVMGLADVDPFILGITQSAGRSTPLVLAAAAILIATASNNLVKGVYAAMFSKRQTGLASLGLLSALAALGLVPLLWLPW